MVYPRCAPFHSWIGTAEYAPGFCVGAGFVCEKHDMTERERYLCEARGSHVASFFCFQGVLFFNERAGSWAPQLSSGSLV